MRRPKQETKPVPRRKVQHRRKHRVINAPRLIISLLLILLAGESVLAVLKSPWFEIRTVRVDGRKLISSRFVSKCIAVPERSNIFLFRTDLIAHRLRRSPIVEEVSVHRRLPATLVVRITERRADFTLSTHAKHYEVDSAGIPFRIVPQPNPKLPVLSCKVPASIHLGRPIKASAFASAMECLKLARAKKSLQVGKITVDQNNDLCLNVRDGLMIRLGQPQQLGDKLDRAERSMQLVPALEYVDVTCPEAPALKPRQSEGNPS